MAFWIGVVTFALGLLGSVALHECGHMWAAQATGMKVRRYFVGFGPKLWSVRRGETEYGLKALPLGGFCDIAGMTPYDELSPEDEPRAMYRQKVWKRLVVLVAGPAMNFVLGFVIVVVVAAGWGLPIIADRYDVRVESAGCVAASVDVAAEVSPPCTGTGPAAAAGIRSGDRIVAVAGHDVANNGDVSARLAAAVQAAPGRPVDVTVARDGQTLVVPVTPTMQRLVDGEKTTEVARIGISMERAFREYSLLGAVPGALGFTGDMLVKTWEALLSLPSKVGALWVAVTGGPRSPDTPISVVGATNLGGQVAERNNIPAFLLLLASLNFFLGVFNLVPLLPLDGGHMAVALWEKVRDLLRARVGKPAGGPVDYAKLLPMTYAVIVIGGAYMLLTLSADILNPLKLY